MSVNYAVNSVLIAFFTLGISSVSCANNVDSTLRADMESVAHRRIFFGHQSVGENLLDGIKQLASISGVQVNIAEVATASDVKPGNIGHAFVAKNGDPIQKLRSFEQAMGQRPSGVDIALVKFCFVDITPETNAATLFLSYRKTIDSLRSKNPRTVFVHVTAPLTTVQGGFKTRLKQMLGREPYGVAENMRREEYNSLIRQAYSGRDPIFDLARTESTAANGDTVTVDSKGGSVPVMDSSYSDDGGHLNAAGQVRAARELIKVLATIPATNKSAH